MIPNVYFSEIQIPREREIVATVDNGRQFLGVRIAQFVKYGQEIFNVNLA